MLGQSPLHYSVTFKATEEIMLRLVLAGPEALEKKMGAKMGEVGMTPFELATSLSKEGKLTDEHDYILELLQLTPDQVEEHEENLEKRCQFLMSSEEAEAKAKERRGWFNEADADSDGQITFAEFEKWMQKVAQRRHLYVPTKEDIIALIKEADVNVEGVINLDEFSAMLECDPTKLHEACAKARWSAVRKRLHTHHNEVRRNEGER